MLDTLALHLLAHANAAPRRHAALRARNRIDPASRGGCMKKLWLALVCGSVLMTPACYTIHHTVGAGAKGDVETEKRQWYVLYGLVPLGEIDSKSLAGDATDYSVKTQASVIDILLNIVTGLVTITSRTITVTR
jgi:hypothetical protein